MNEIFYYTYDIFRPTNEHNNCSTRAVSNKSVFLIIVYNTHVYVIKVPKLNKSIYTFMYLNVQEQHCKN